jgi:hypothetical protein
MQAAELLQLSTRDVRLSPSPGTSRYKKTDEESESFVQNLTYKIGVGEDTFAIHLLVSKITPTKKMIDSKQRIVTLIGP